MAPHSPQSSGLDGSPLKANSLPPLHEIERLNRRLQALSSAAIRVQGALTPHEVLAAVGAELKAIGLECQFSLLTDDGGKLTPQYVSLMPGVLEAAERLVGFTTKELRLPVDQVSALRSAVRERRAVCIAGEAAIREIFPGMPVAVLRQMIGLIGAEDVIVAPLLTRGQVIGAMSVWARDLDPKDVPAVVVFAQQAATAYENARLFQEAQERLAQTRALQEITASITDQRESTPILRTIVERAREIFAADRIALFLIDPDTGHLSYKASHGLSPEYIAAVDANYREAADGRALDERRPVAIADAANDPLMQPLWPAVRAEGFCSLLILPMYRGDQPVGGMVLYHDERHVYPPEEIRLASAFAEQAAIALERAWLEADLRHAVERAEAHLRQAETLQRFSTLVAATFDIQTILERGADAIQEAFDADRALIFLRDPETNELQPSLIRGLSIRYVEAVAARDRAIIGGQVLDALRPVAVEDLRTHPSMAAFQSGIGAEGVRAMLAVPLAHGGEVIGTMVIFHDRPRRYEEYDLYLARVFGDQVAVAVRDAALYQQAQAERRRLATIIDQMAEGVVVMDADERVVLMNQAAREILGETPLPLFGSIDKSGLEGTAASARSSEPRPADEVGGIDRFRIVDARGTLVPREETPMYRALHEGEVFHSVSVTIRRHHPGATAYSSAYEVRDLVMSLAPIRDERGYVVLIVSVFRDVTAEQALERAKDGFLAIAAHELRSPVAVLKGYVDLLLRGFARTGRPPDTDQVRTQVGRMSIQVTRLAVLVENLLDVSRIEAGRLGLKLTPVDVVAVARAMLEQHQPTAPAHQLVLWASQPKVVVEADLTRLEQVLRNLLENAIKYSPGGGPIMVEVGTVPEPDGARRPRAVASVRMGEIRVIDRGVGIASEHLPHIFGPFYQAEAALTRRTGGLGLGLYVSKRIIEAQGGTIRVESRPGVGTTFAFTLPLAQ